VTALAGALAASMGEMVLNYSVGKQGLESHHETLKSALQEFHRARQLLLSLMVEDQAAYQDLTAARKLPAGSAERDAQIPVALLASIRTPEAIGATALAIIELCERVADVVNYYLLSDLAVSAELAMATVRCAAYNVRVNLVDLADPAERQRIEDDVQHMLAHAVRLIQRVNPRIWARHERKA
jgi:formiminotetrahydrofolate cyclodeaminase